MRTLTLLLLVVNILVFAWLSWQVPEPVKTSIPELSASPLVLLAELPAHEAVALPPSVPVEVVAVVETGCQGIGPFAERDAVIAARDALLAAGIAALPRATDASHLLGYWVHTPPAGSREAAAALVDRLRRAGIRDFYLITDQDHRDAVSLGVFGQPQAAEQHAARLRGLGFDVRVGERRRQMTAWWLEFEAPAPGSDEDHALADFVAGTDGIRLESRPCE